MCATDSDTGEAPHFARALPPFPPCLMAAMTLPLLQLPLPDLLPRAGRIPVALSPDFHDVISSHIDLRVGLEGALPPGLTMNSATARWIGHRWAFSGYTPVAAPPLMDDAEFELLPPPPQGNPVSRAKTRRTQKKKPEVALRPSSTSAERTSNWKRMSLRLLCFGRRFCEALSSLTRPAPSSSTAAGLRCEAGWRTAPSPPQGLRRGG